MVEEFRYISILLLSSLDMPQKKCKCVYWNPCLFVCIGHITYCIISKILRNLSLVSKCRSQRSWLEFKTLYVYLITYYGANNFLKIKLGHIFKKTKEISMQTIFPSLINTWASKQIYKILAPKKKFKSCKKVPISPDKLLRIEK